MKTVRSMNAGQFQECLRHVYCMGPHEFVEVFGEHSGEYQWNKYYVEFKRDVAKWITYLDGSNRELLFNYLNKWLVKVGA